MRDLKIEIHIIIYNLLFIVSLHVSSKSSKSVSLDCFNM